MDIIETGESVFECGREWAVQQGCGCFLALAMDGGIALLKLP
ncbi:MULTISPECIES: hypothetical protein [Burkholderia]|nr:MULTISPECIES: hypothetical protein [Burkholderia]MDN7788980.1 hypothetical protein [Burkholderia contaminans]